MFKINDDFLLSNELAYHYYHEYAKDMPIYDYHNHLVPQDILEDKVFESIGEMFLRYDHYKWRVLRTCGVSEDEITGDNVNYDALFKKLCTIMPRLIGNPMYHWCHLELKNYFNCNLEINEKNFEAINNHCNSYIKENKLSPRKLLVQSNVKKLCTTDDPIDDLNYHQKINEEFEIEVLPTFRPDKVLNLDSDGFDAYIKQLEKVVGKDICSINDLLVAIEERICYFKSHGCQFTDHAFETFEYINSEYEEVNTIFTSRSNSKIDVIKYKSYMFLELSKLYYKHSLVQQIHIGASRNASEVMFNKLGPDTGFDYICDKPWINNLAAYFSQIEKIGLPKTIIYTLDSKYYENIVTLMGCFQGASQSNIQLGSGWWFNDQLDGMNRQMEVLMQMGVFGNFIGMLTDSRSFLSFSRHEYFRRLLCNKISLLVQSGQYTNDEDTIKKLIQDICFNNINEYN